MTGNQKVITLNNREKAFEKGVKKLSISENSCFVMEASGSYEKKFVRKNATLISG